MHEAIGKTQSFHDQIDPARASAMHATLGLQGTAPNAGDPLPPFWHQIYFWDPQPPQVLGQDCHPKTGTGLIPDLGLPQRMWAGGTLKFDGPVLIGYPAEKTTTVENIVEKTGRSGRLAFVTLRHEIKQYGEIKVTEHQDIVYKQPQHGAHKPNIQQAKTGETVSNIADFDTTLLFRYSALTFNGHRIHYDLDYCQNVEGYAGLVVHGPLLAQLLMHLAHERLNGLKTFQFRATSPLMHFESAEICMGKDGEMWVRGPNDRLCMTAQAT